MTAAFSSCQVHLTASRLGRVQLLACVGVLLGSLASGRWPLWAAALLCAPLLAWAWRAWLLAGLRHPEAPVALTASPAGVLLQTRSGQHVALPAAPRPWVTSHLVLLCPRSPVTGARWPLVLWRDAMPAADWAALRRTLRAGQDRAGVDHPAPASVQTGPVQTGTAQTGTAQIDMAGPGGSESRGSMGTSTVSWARGRVSGQSSV